MLPFMFLSNDLTHCNRDGYGSMSNLLRASVSLALHYNLTYVHHPLRCSHGVDWRVLDRWFDCGHGAPCDAACIDSAVASGGLREASHFFGCRDGATRCRVGSRRHTYRNLELSELDVRAGRNTTQTANSGLSLVAASLARGVIVSQKDQTYIAGSLAGLKYGGTICARDGVCEQAGFLRAWGAFIADV